MVKHTAVANLVGMVAFTFASSAAFGKSLQCNSQQTKCLTETKYLTIGDQVGIFNDDGQLVAKGEINAMRGDRRSLVISERTGTIRKGYNLALLKPDQTADSYRIYRDPTAMSVGGAAGYSTLSVGEGSPATEFTGFAQWRQWGGMQLIGRFVYTNMNGDVTRNGPDGTEVLPITMNGLGLLGGVGYIIRESKPLSFRAEVAAGGMQINASVGGDSALADSKDVNSRIKNGLNAYARWSFGAMYNTGAWHWHVDFAESLVQQAFANTLSFGLSTDLK